MNNSTYSPLNWQITQVSEDSIFIEYRNTDGAQSSEFTEALSKSSASEHISIRTHQYILALSELITTKLRRQIIDVIVSYSSLLVIFNKHSALQLKLDEQLADVCLHFQLPLKPNSKTDNVINIEVYYSSESGWDLVRVAEQCKMSVDNVIDLHSQQTYQAFATGFTPGFCYLGIVDKSLQLPRLSTPRLKVPKGGVAIAEQQCAIYPQATPGGWHILGQTAQPMLSSNPNILPRLKVGDRVKFTPVSKQDFLAAGGVVSYE